MTLILKIWLIIYHGHYILYQVEMAWINFLIMIFVFISDFYSEFFYKLYLYFFIFLLYIYYTFMVKAVNIKVEKIRFYILFLF